MYRDSDVTSHPVVPRDAERPIARRKLSHEVLDRLLGRIRAGDFPVGSLLPSECEPTQLHGVGRPAVREALQTLDRMRFVTIVHGEGARMQPLSVETVIEQSSDSAMHLLAGSSDLLEHLRAARLAAERATPSQLAPLREALDAHLASVDDPHPARFLATDMALHRAVAALSGNPIYIAVSQAMLQWLERFHHDAVRAPGAERTALAEHVELVECVAARDANGAAAAVTRHLKRAHRLYHGAPAR